MKITLDLDQRSLNLLRIACENVDMDRAWSRDLDNARMLDRRYALAILADTLFDLERAIHTTSIDPRDEAHFNWHVRLDR
jgi:hypothetical protein